MIRAALLSLAFASPALAQTQCGPRETVIAQLADKYSEARRGMGMAGNAAVLELYTSDTGTFTITVTLPDGRTCLIASGEGWEVMADPVANGDPA